MKPMVACVSIACIVLALAAGAVSAQTTASQGSASQAATVEQQVRAAHQQLLEAIRNNDKETARGLMADDVTWVNMQGVIATRDEVLGGPLTPPKEVNIDQVRTFADTAIVTGAAVVASGSQVRFLQEWVNRGGQWRLFAHQGTAVAPAETPGQPAPTPPVGTAGRMVMRNSAPTLNTDAERAIWAAQTELVRAFLKGDAAAYGKRTADDFVRVGPNGEVQNKSQFLDMVKANANQAGGQLNSDEAQIAVTGDTARLVVTLGGTLPGGQAQPPSRMTRVFVKRNGEWQQEASILTPIQSR